MRKIAMGFFAAIMFTLTACGVSVDAGTVSDKRMEDAYTEQVEGEDCEWDTDTKYVNGKKKTTREYECEPNGEFETVEHEAQYFVTLEDKDGNDEEHNVDADTYESLAVGDFYEVK